MLAMGFTPPNGRLQAAVILNYRLNPNARKGIFLIEHSPAPDNGPDGAQPGSPAVLFLGAFL